jgi:hypothetical protein
VLDKQKLDEIQAKLEYSPQKFLRYLPEETRVYSFKYKFCPISEKELEHVNENILQRYMECMQNNKNHFRHLP